MAFFWIIFTFEIIGQQFDQGWTLQEYKTGSCMCDPVLSLEEAVLQSDGIFSGKVLKLDTLTADDFWAKGETNQKIRIKLKVNEVFKDVELKQVVYVYSDLGKESCGYRFSEGMDYLIYGIRQTDSFRGKSVYFTSRCMRTRMPNLEESEELRQLLQSNNPTVCILRSSYFKN